MLAVGDAVAVVVAVAEIEVETGLTVTATPESDWVPVLAVVGTKA
jgi:hypothetical protein